MRKIGFPQCNAWTQYRADTKPSVVKSFVAFPLETNDLLFTSCTKHVYSSTADKQKHERSIGNIFPELSEAHLHTTPVLWEDDEDEDEEEQGVLLMRHWGVLKMKCSHWNKDMKKETAAGLHSHNQKERMRSSHVSRPPWQLEVDKVSISLLSLAISGPNPELLHQFYVLVKSSSSSHTLARTHPPLLILFPVYDDHLALSERQLIRVISHAVIDGLHPFWPLLLKHTHTQCGINLYNLFCTAHMESSVYNLITSGSGISSWYDGTYGVCFPGYVARSQRLTTRALRASWNFLCCSSKHRKWHRSENKAHPTWYNFRQLGSRGSRTLYFKLHTDKLIWYTIIINSQIKPFLGHLPGLSVVSGWAAGPLL